jgi:hypothetical protein
MQEGDSVWVQGCSEGDCLSGSRTTSGNGGTWDYSAVSSRTPSLDFGFTRSHYSGNRYDDFGN